MTADQLFGFMVVAWLGLMLGIAVLRIHRQGKRRDGIQQDRRYREAGR